MIREEYGHSYRQCPVCKKEGLPKGIIVCCQNKECNHVINTATGNDFGEYKSWGGEGNEESFYDKNGMIIPEFLFTDTKEPIVVKYRKIYEFVYSLSQKDMVILEQVINDKRRRYGGG